MNTDSKHPRDGRRRFLRLAATLSIASVAPRWTWAALPDLAGHTMGTAFRIRLGGDVPVTRLPLLRRVINGALDEVESRFSLYRPNSELAALNRAPGGVVQVLSAGDIDLVRAALAVRAESGGAYDPFAAPLVARWGFGPGAHAMEPDLAVSPALLERVRGASLEIRDGGVIKNRADATLDLNGIAKGEAVDRLAAILSTHGIADYLVEIGGEIRCAGSPTDDGANGWLVGVEGPGGRLVSRVRLDRLAVATSGDFVHYFIRGGRRYSHVIDPRSGLPVDHGLALVSVAAADCRMADAWSTALMVMGPDAGFLHALERGIAALFLARGASGPQLRRTPAWARLEANA